MYTKKNKTNYYLTVQTYNEDKDELSLPPPPILKKKKINNNI